MSGRRAIRLVALRELRQQIHSRVFLLSTLVLTAVVAVALVTPALGGKSKTTYRYGLVGAVPAGLERALAAAATVYDAKAAVRVYADRAAAEAALAKKQTSALLLPGESRLVFESDANDRAVAIADAAVRSLRLPAALARYGLTVDRARQLLAAPVLTVGSLHPATHARDEAAYALAISAAVLMLLGISTYGGWVLQGVVQEKTSRVVEVLLATLRPRHLLAGKVLGIGLLGLAQIALVAGVAAGLLVSGATRVSASLAPSAALVIPWFALGFALYAVGYAVSGALVTRQEDVQAATLPVTAVMIVSYFVSYGVALGSPDGFVAQVATVFPTTAPFALPARVALTHVPVWQHALAVAFALAAIYGLVRLGGRLYSVGLLQSGPRLGLRAAWRLRS